MVDILPIFLDNKQADFFTNTDKMPPYFTAKFFFDFINTQNKLQQLLTDPIETKCLRFTTPNKKTSHRRELKVPNPYLYLQLAHKVSKLYTKQNNKPEVPNLKTDKLLNLSFEKGKPTLKKYDVISSRCYKDVQGYSYHLKIDISQFYPSIYTHSIPWAILGKEVAKKKYEEPNTKCDLYNLGNEIDTLLQKMNSKQTKGIPVGATLFHFVAKLITDRIDKEFIEKEKEKLKEEIDFEFSHYVDDYYVFCHSEADANRLLSKFGNILNRYELHINAQKTHISHVDEWSVIPFWQPIIEEVLDVFNDLKNDVLWSKLTEKRLLRCFEKIRKLRKGKYKAEHHLSYFLSALLSCLEKPLSEYYEMLEYYAILYMNFLRGVSKDSLEVTLIYSRSSSPLFRLHHFQKLLENFILPFILQCISLEPSTIQYIAEQKTVKMLKPFLQNNEKSKKVLKATLQKTIDHYYTQELMWVLYVLIQYELLDIVSDEDVLYDSLKKYPNSMVKCLVMEIELDPNFCNGFEESLFEKTKSDYLNFKDEDWKDLFKSEDWLLYFFMRGKGREQNEDFTLCETGIPLIDNFFKATTGNKTFFDKEAKVLKRSYYDPHFQKDASLS
jgi:hypothetical protein